MPNSQITARGTTYTITEVEQISGLAAHTLRFYERMGLLWGVSRGPGGRREYTQEHLRWVKFIKNARAVEMSVADIARYVSLARQGDRTVRDRRQMMEEHLNRLRRQSEQIAESLRYLEGQLELHRRDEAGLVPVE